jgi:hypothetical protein
VIFSCIENSASFNLGTAGRHDSNEFRIYEF